MFKLLFLGLNFLNILNYQIIKEEEVLYEEIIYSDDTYIIYLEAGITKLKTQDDEWIRSLDLKGQIDVITLDRDIYIFNYSKGVFKCLVYNSSGEIIKEKTIFENNLLNYQIKYNDGFYIVGSINTLSDEIFINNAREGLAEKNGFIMKFDKLLNIESVNLYGGGLNDEFFDICFSDEAIYIAGKKDVLTGGDFGNGGKNDGDIFIASLDYNFRVNNYLIVNDYSEVINLRYFKDYLYFSSGKFLYKLDSELELIKTNEIPEPALLCIPAYFNKIIVISKLKTYVYDLFTLKIIACLDNQVSIETIKEFKNIMYIKADKYYYFDIACLEGIKYLNPYYSEVMPIIDVETCFGRANYLEDTGDVVFDPLVYGTYLRNFKFINNFGIEFFVQRECLVQKDANVSEGGIYPLGYNLLFNGRAYLNGSSITNNYSIASIGEYSLRLVGINNEEYSINFTVAGGQINFREEKIKDYHNIANLDEVYYLSINCPKKISEVTSVKVDGIECFDILVKKEGQIISVKMPASKSIGLKYHIINGINYKMVIDELEEDYYESLEEVYIVNIVKDTMDIEINQVNKNEYFFNIHDNNSARYFLLSYIYNNQEYSLKYPLDSNKIFLESLPTREDLSVNLQIYYDLGDKSYRKTDLMKIEFSNINNNNILEIDVLKKEESLQEFKVNILNNEIARVTINNEVVYEKIDKDYYSHIIIGTCILFACSFLIYKIRDKKYKKKIKVN